MAASQPTFTKETAMNKFSDFRLQDKDLQIVQDNIYGSLENPRCLRANILNDAHNGKSQSEIWRQYGVHRNTVRNCLSNYQKRGIEALEDAPRSGRPTDTTSWQEKLDQVLDLCTSVADVSRLLGISFSKARRICKKYGIRFEEKREYLLFPCLTGKSLRLVGLFISLGVMICIFAVQAKGEESIFSHGVKVHVKTPQSETLFCSNDESSCALSAWEALTRPSPLFGNDSTIQCSAEEFLHRIAETYQGKDVELMAVGTGVDTALFQHHFSYNSLCSDVNGWLSTVEECLRLVDEPKKSRELLVSELSKCVHVKAENRPSVVWQILPGEDGYTKNEISKEENGPSCKFEFNLRDTNGNIVTAKVDLSENVPSLIEFGLANGLSDYTAQAGKIEQFLEQILKGSGKELLHLLLNVGVLSTLSTEEEVRRGVVETTLGRQSVLIKSSVSSELHKNEYMWTPTTMMQTLKKTNESSYEKSAEELNERFCRTENESLSANHIKNLVKSIGNEIKENLENYVESILKKYNYYGIKALQTEKVDKNKEHKTKEKEELSESSSNKTTVDDEIHDKIKELIQDKYVEYSKVDNNENLIKIENPNKKSIYISIDGITVHHQNEKRKTKKGGVSYKSRETVENVIVWMGYEGGSYRISTNSVFQACKCILAFLQVNNLLDSEHELVFITDGAREIRIKIEDIFEKLEGIRVIHILDWYHIAKRVNEYGSMALFTGKEHKEENEEVKKQILSFLWCGDVDSACKYIRELDRKTIRSQKWFDKLIEYFVARKPYIHCYELRKKLGLINSSNRVETSNKMIVADRQKNNGTSWSFDGSYSLAVTKTLMLNDELEHWLNTKSLRFSPKMVA